MAEPSSMDGFMRLPGKESNASSVATLKTIGDWQKLAVHSGVQRCRNSSLLAHLVYRPGQPFDFQPVAPLQVGQQRSLASVSEYTLESIACVSLDSPR